MLYRRQPARKPHKVPQAVVDALNKLDELVDAAMTTWLREAGPVGGQV